MAGDLRVSLVVPVWNEQERLARNSQNLLDFVSKFDRGSELVVVDDGSTDATLDIANAIRPGDSGVNLSVLARPHLGKGAALRAGLAHAAGSVIAFCDVDLATSLPDMDSLIETAASGRALLIGSRGRADSVLLKHESRMREVLGTTFNRVAQMMLVRGIRDTQCGAKAASRDVWERLLRDSRENGFAWDLEVIALARRIGVPVVEVGVEWTHQPGSKVSVVPDGMAMVRAVPRIWANVHRVPAGERRP